MTHGTGPVAENQTSLKGIIGSGNLAIHSMNRRRRLPCQDYFTSDASDDASETESDKFSDDVSDEASCVTCGLRIASVTTALELTDGCPSFVVIAIVSGGKKLVPGTYMAYSPGTKTSVEFRLRGTFAFK